MGLGSALSVPLARAREKAAEARLLIADRIDPILARRATSTVPSFGVAAENMIDTKSPELRSETSRRRWIRSLNVYAVLLKGLPVDQIGTEEVLNVLRPIWTSKPETAQKTRGFIEAVLDAAKAKGQRYGENPARWRGHLDHLLPKRQNLTRGHHAALPFRSVPSFLAALRDERSVGAWALEFTILTAARTGETVGATWSEVDLEAGVWTVPASRTKAGRVHRIPLVDRTLTLLGELGEGRVGNYVFPGQKPDRHISTGTMDRVLDRMAVVGATVHGFRSSFRDWAGECTDFPREVAEAALAHSVGNETERAYRRADALEKRRALMKAWSEFCAGEPSRTD